MTLRERAGFTLATWFGAGMIPKIPGTAGSIAAVPLCWALCSLGTPYVVVAAIVVTAVGVWSAQVVADVTGKKDPQIVVIDEVAGMLVTSFAALPEWRSQLAGLVLFRLADQFKPFPARMAERRLPGGWGIVFDDVFAGVWGAAGLFGLRKLGWV